MPRSDNPALQKRESRLYRVGMEVPVNVLLRAVIDHVMLLGWYRSFAERRGIAGEVIGGLMQPAGGPFKPSFVFWLEWGV